MRSDSGRGVERPTTAKETMEDTALQISFRHFHGEIESISTGIENVIRLLIKSVLHKSQLLLSEKRMCVDGGGKREEGGGRREEEGERREEEEEGGGRKREETKVLAYPKSKSAHIRFLTLNLQLSILTEEFLNPLAIHLMLLKESGGHTAMTMVGTQQ